MTLPSRAVERITPTYGWSAEGKTSAEIAGDVRQTRYRLEADLRALRARVARAKWPAALAAAAGVAVFLIRKIRRS